MKDRPEDRTAGATTPGDLETMSIGQVLKEIRRDLHNLADRTGHIPSYREEIDRALGRIAAIERHLGIHKKPAA
jgi:hypothetical protein